MISRVVTVLTFPIKVVVELSATMLWFLPIMLVLGLATLTIVELANCLAILARY